MERKRLKITARQLMEMTAMTHEPHNSIAALKAAVELYSGDAFDPTRDGTWLAQTAKVCHQLLLELQDGAAEAAIRTGIENIETVADATIPQQAEPFPQQPITSLAQVPTPGAGQAMPQVPTPAPGPAPMPQVAQPLPQPQAMPQSAPPMQQSGQLTPQSTKAEMLAHLVTEHQTYGQLVNWEDVRGKKRSERSPDFRHKTIQTQRKDGTWSPAAVWLTDDKEGWARTYLNQVPVAV